MSCGICSLHEAAVLTCLIFATIGCATSVAANPDISRATRAPATQPDLMPGTHCTTAKMPELRVDKDEHQVRLAAGAFKMRLPTGWKAELERPDLVVITSLESPMGVRPVFEMFVSPICDTYQGIVVLQRVAARGLAELLPAEDTIGQIRNGQWRMGLGGQVGKSLILQDAVVKTSKGERALNVYATDLAHAKSFGLHAAAVCLKADENEGLLSKCEKTYVDMLRQATF